MEHEEIMEYGEKIQHSAESITDNISSYTIIRSVLFDEAEFEEVPTSQPMQCMQDFLAAEINGDKDLAMKKLFAAGVALANDSGVLPLPDATPEMISTIADETLTRAKLAYKVATGEIQIEDVTDALIDNATARAMAVADVAVEKGLPLAVEGVCDVVSVAFPPFAGIAQVAKPMLKQIAVRVAPKVKEVVKKGICKVSHAAKETARAAVSKVEKAGSKIFSWIRAKLFS